ncbi:M15 family metallopeptidase [Acinetobacter shaoyimingii]|uniref:M15 family metallopeptidase n=1 Tax=Acinetobacter shaoyimingii TaxID=2715164 RepID=A0A6G8RZT8_9GAMM|nr:M15 family metallopeptidase [Acinetobacter shaoyimingii]QIO07360.1 M15 family metallopeptidase [Acinetobacter shaoyimingii]
MIAFLIISFIIMVPILALMMSYELREKCSNFYKNLLPKSKEKLISARKFAYEVNQAASIDQTQSHWHLQQWWILFAGILLLSSILFFAYSLHVAPTRVEANYLRANDPQIYNLLNGDLLSPPPPVEESLVQAAILAEIDQDPTIPSQPVNTVFDGQEADQKSHAFETNLIDRKWDKMHPSYKQRLLMVFKIMKERHGYEMVLLEGYRSPERQTRLSGNTATTLAKAFQSYHQFGLAADVAFKRNGKVVISERDPWAMRGYQLYGETAESVGLTWGGRWTRIHDYGHTEFRMPGLRKNRESAERLIAEAQNQGLMANNIH